MSYLTIILIVAAVFAGVSLLAVAVWFGYTTYLNGVERNLAARKGIYRDLVAGLATRDRALLDPVLHQARTLRDFEALEAVLEEQARGAVERPQWLLDTYDRLGLVERYIQRLRESGSWRERAFAAELLGRVGSAKAVPALLASVQATRDEDADVREIALRALARIGDPRAVEPLVEALKQAEVWLAPRIADILARHGTMVVEPMIDFLEERSQHPARAWAANILGEVRAARAFPALVRALDDLDDEVRAKAAAALGRIGDPRAVTYLLDHLLTDPAPFVRARIASAMGQFQEPEVVDTLVRALGDAAWWVRMRSVEALEHIGPAAEGPLMLALDDADPEIRIRAAVALERLGVPNRIIHQIEGGSASPEAIETLTRFGLAGAREFLAEQLLHPSATVREAVVKAIHRSGRHDLGGELMQLATHDPDPDIRTLVYDILRQFGHREAVPAAIAGLGDTNQQVRAAAMKLVGELGEAEVAELIRPKTGDPEPVVRAAAARALGQVRAQDAQPELARLLHDPVPDVRAAAAEGVADGRGSWATPELLRLLGDSDSAVRMAAAAALGRVADRSSLPPLLRAFQTGGPELRRVLARTVALIEPEALPELIDVLLESRDTEARLAIVDVLTQVRAPHTADLLQLVWQDGEPEVRAAAATALGTLGSEQAIALLGGGLDDPDGTVRTACVNALIRHMPGQYGPKFLSLLSEDPAAEVRERAALATGLLRVPGGAGPLAHACRPEEPLEVRAAAALAIGAYDEESIVAQVVDMMDEEPVRNLLRERLRQDPAYRLIRTRLRESRQVELRALASLSRDQMEATLVEGMRGVLDAGERVRLVGALRAFEGERSRRALIYAVRSDPSPEVRAAALRAIGELLEPEELLFTARRAVTDPQPAVRRVAVALFARIPPDLALPTLVKVLRVEDHDDEVMKIIAGHAEKAFDVFMDLIMGLRGDGREGVMVAHVARHIHHHDLGRLLPPLARSGEPEVREATAELFTYRPDLVDGDTLDALLKDPVAAVRIAAVRATGAARQFVRLEARLEDPDPAVRRQAAIELRNAPSAGALARIVADPDDTVRATAWITRLIRNETTALPPDLDRETLAGQIRATLDIETLHRVARTDVEAEHRLAAGIALAVVGDPAGAKIAASDPSDEVRAGVAAVRQALGDQP